MMFLLGQINPDSKIITYSYCLAGIHQWQVDDLVLVILFIIPFVIIITILFFNCIIYIATNVVACGTWVYQYF